MDYPLSPPAGTDRIAARDVPYMMALTEKLHTAGIITSCINCIHFIEMAGACALTDGLHPPPRIVAQGCPQWFDFLLVGELPPKNP